MSAAHELTVLEFVGGRSGSGRAGAAACICSLLPAALDGSQEYSYAGTQDREVGEHLDD